MTLSTRLKNRMMNSRYQCRFAEIVVYLTQNLEVLMGNLVVGPDIGTIRLHLVQRLVLTNLSVMCPRSYRSRVLLTKALSMETLCMVTSVKAKVFAHVDVKKSGIEMQGEISL